MRVVNVRELKARLSAHLREVGRGETLLVTDRGRVVAQLGPVALAERRPAESTDALARLVAGGARPPLRERRPGDYRRTDPSPGIPAAKVDELLDWLRGDAE
jgi:antitoxin (DNA-binding transcriptional repressor) of toxin-antitoxin stability system